jgi:adenylyl- and sulfurtransferase ThiI
LLSQVVIKEAKEETNKKVKRGGKKKIRLRRNQTRNQRLMNLQKVPGIKSLGPSWRSVSKRREIEEKDMIELLNQEKKGEMSQKTTPRLVDLLREAKNPTSGIRQILCNQAKNHLQ